MIVARKTLDAIDAAMRADGGAAFRMLQAKTLPLCTDAYEGKRDDGMRRHYGASANGEECSRKLFYDFRWASTENPKPSMVRLWNRGHLEEGRMIALLLMIGVEVEQYDSNGKQFRIADHGGHYGGSLDSKLLGVPDMPTVRMLGEYKTHNERSFEDLISKGLHDAKFTHFVQCQQYMLKQKLTHTLYMAVNKNNDELHAEIFELNPELAQHYVKRAGAIINVQTPPPRINNNASWYACKWCKHRLPCHFKQAPLVNCRTCAHSTAVDGGWHCGYTDASVRIPEEVQRRGCGSYQRANWD